MKATRTLADRLQSKLVEGPNGCLEFTGTRLPTGYGTIRLGGKALGKVYTHRAAWRLANGPIPEGMYVLHRCDNPPCCNVEHLFLGTPADNMHDMAAKGRNYWIERTHCRRGHPWDEANTRWHHGTRVCRACEKVRYPAKKARRAARRLAQATGEVT